MSSTGRDNVIVHIETMFSKRHNSGSYSPKIHKVFDQLRQMNEKAYNPGLVSIGPIHHDKDYVQDMEQVKVAYLYEYLQRRNETVEKYVVKLRELEGRARDCYSNFIPLPDSDRFVEMLLLDGFFVIMFFRKSAFKYLRSKNDYIFHSEQAWNRLLLDLLLVENQLPLSIFVANLLKSSKDVQILRHAGILENWVGEDDLLCDMFNLLGKHVLVSTDNFRYLEVLDQVNKHCSRRRNKWMATLRRNYFNSPWAILSVIAAVILLLLTAVQTVYSVLKS